MIHMCIGLTACTSNAGQQHGLGLHGHSNGHFAEWSHTHSDNILNDLTASLGHIMYMIISNTANGNFLIHDGEDNFT